MNKSAKLSTEPYKGVRDFYPADQALLNYVTTTWQRTCERMGYVEYGASILEPSDLYKAKGAENEELISDQTYTFTDRGEREVSLRPEMTPTVARMVAGKRRELGYPLRWYSIPNCFRYERPQRGRLREFWQLNADIFGTRSSAADAEIIQLAYEVLKAFGGSESDFVIRIGSRTHLDALSKELGLSVEKEKELLGLLDRKDKMPHEEFAQRLSGLGVPQERLSAENPPEDVAEVLATLSNLGIGNAVYDPTIVRGFAYYTGIVFEVFDTHTDNRRALFGGGRYDNLTALFDDEPLPGVGFGMGDVTVRDFLEVRGLLPQYLPPTKAYIALTHDALLPQAAQLAQELRAQGINVALDFGEKKIGDQIKAANKQQIPYVIVVGEDELMAGAFTVRDLMSGEQSHLGREELAAFFLAR
jgi:histidyl-tRNA synthetase